MAKELYVGHISEQATEEDLRKLFELMGVVTSVHLIVDEQTGEFKRCGYVRMLSEVNLTEVVETLDGTYLIDRCIVVSIAVPQKDRPAKTPYVKRKTLSAGRPAAGAKASATGQLKARPSVADGAAKSSRPAADKRSRPTVKETTKTGRSSAAKDAVSKYRPSASKDASGTERHESGKRGGQSAAGKSHGQNSRPASKGRR